MKRKFMRRNFRFVRGVVCVVVIQLLFKCYIHMSKLQ